MQRWPSVTIYRVHSGGHRWFWRLRAVNGAVIAEGGKAYATRHTAEAALGRARRALSGFTHFRLLPALGLSLLVFASPAAGQTRYIGQETVGQFRSWSDAMQTGYVVGVYSYATHLGLRCPIGVTVGEYRAALVYNQQLAGTDSLPKAMVALFLRNGCTSETQ